MCFLLKLVCRPRVGCMSKIPRRSCETFRNLLAFYVFPFWLNFTTYRCKSTFFSCICHFHEVLDDFILFGSGTSLFCVYRSILFWQLKTIRRWTPMFFDENSLMSFCFRKQLVYLSTVLFQRGGAVVFLHRVSSLLQNSWWLCSLWIVSHGSEDLHPRFGHLSWKFSRKKAYGAGQWISLFSLYVLAEKEWSGGDGSGHERRMKVVECLPLLVVESMLKMIVAQALEFEREWGVVWSSVSTPPSRVNPTCRLSLNLVEEHIRSAEAFENLVQHWQISKVFTINEVSEILGQQWWSYCRLCLASFCFCVGLWLSLTCV